MTQAHTHSYKHTHTHTHTHKSIPNFLWEFNKDTWNELSATVFAESASCKTAEQYLSFQRAEKKYRLSISGVLNEWAWLAQEGGEGWGGTLSHRHTWPHNGQDGTKTSVWKPDAATVWTLIKGRQEKDTERIRGTEETFGGKLNVVNFLGFSE